jgi:hypothetical protein
MRDYSKVGPQFWNGKTGKALKAKGSEAVIVALYLMTCQHANMLGLYYLSKAYAAVDTGLGMEGASKGLQGAIEAGFCKFDEDSEVVWVIEMAAYQIGDRLDPKDLRCKGVQREFDALPENPFLGDFYERYGAVFCMTSARGKAKPHSSPLEAPPKPGAGAGAGERTGAEAGAEVGAAPSPLPAPPAPPPPPPAAEAASTRGTRLKADFVLPQAWGNWALAKYPHWTADIVRAIASKFKNHWIAKSGKDATKVDWKATWENWCDSGITQGENPPPTKDGAAASAQQLAASLAKAERIRKAMAATNGAVAPAANASEVIDA